MKFWLLCAALLATAHAAEPLPPGIAASLGGGQPMEHPQRIRSLAFTPDSASILTVDDAARVWNATTGELRRRIDSLRLAATCGAISPDGKTIVLGENEPMLRLVDLASGETRARYTDPTSRTGVVAWSPDGKWLASRDRRDVVLREAASGKETRRWPSGAGEVSALHFSPDSRTLASLGSDGKSIRIHAVDGEKAELVLPGEGSYPGWLRFSPDGAVVAGSCTISHPGGTSEFVRLWDAKTGAVLREIQRGMINDGAFSPDGKMLAIAGMGFIHLYDAATGAVAHRLPPFHEHANRIAFSPDGKMLAAAQEKRVRRWKTGTWEEIQPGGGK